MITYRGLLECQRKAVINRDMKYAAISRSKHKTNDHDNINSTHKMENNIPTNGESNKEKMMPIPGTIKDLLKSLIERKVTIVLDAEVPPEKVEIEAVVGDLLVAEFEDHRFTFVDIKCIREVIIDREELLESLLNVLRAL